MSSRAGDGGYCACREASIALRRGELAGCSRKLASSDDLLCPMSTVYGVGK